MDYKCELVERPAEVTLSIRARCAMKELPTVLPASYRKIGDYLKEIGEKPAGAPFVAYTNIVDMENMDIEAGVATAEKLPARDDIQPSQLPALKAASCIYVGPYPDLPKGYDALAKWMKEQGLEGTGTFYEIYVDDPEEVKPAELRTQILMMYKTI